MSTVLKVLALLLMLCSSPASGKALPGRASHTGDLWDEAESLGQALDFGDLQNGTTTSAQVLGSHKPVQECLKQKGIEKILRELNKMTDNIKASLPRDTNKNQRLLPKLTKSAKGVAVMKEILDFYSDHVFNRVSPRDQSTESTLEVLSRLRRDVDHCLHTHPSSLSPTEKHLIWKMKKTFHELKAAGVHKAVGEFKSLLSWVDTYVH